MEQMLLPLLLLLVVAVPLFLGSRKQKRMMQEQQQLQESLAPGDRVMTTSGLYATVADVTENDTIDLEIAPGVVTTWLRQAVREKVNPVQDSDTDTDTDATDEDGDGFRDSAERDEAGSTERRSSQASTAQVAPPLEHGK